MEKQKQQQETLNTPGVIQKYQASAKIVNDILNRLIKKISIGSKLIQLCLWSDNEIYLELNKIYNKKNMFKGLAYPTTISINQICGHMSPLPEDNTSIHQGDLVKISLGVHIDGFASFAAHTIVARSNIKQTVKGKQAQVILAAYKASQAALRLIKPGHTNTQITEVIQKVCQSYQVQPLQGVLSHELKKHLIDGNKVILNKQTFDQKVQQFEFNINDVIALDIFVTSSSTSKPKQMDIRCSIYKRAIDQNYNLKLKQSRIFFNEVLSRYPSFCFSLNSFEDQNIARLGIKQCLQHDLLIPYPVLIERNGIMVAQFKTTVMITKGKTTALTGIPINQEEYQSQFKIHDQKILQLLSTSMEKKKKNKQQEKQLKF